MANVRGNGARSAPEHVHVPQFTLPLPPLPVEEILSPKAQAILDKRVAEREKDRASARAAVEELALSEEYLERLAHALHRFFFPDNPTATPAGISYRITRAKTGIDIEPGWSPFYSSDDPRAVILRLLRGEETGIGTYHLPNLPDTKITHFTIDIDGKVKKPVESKEDAALEDQEERARRRTAKLARWEEEKVEKWEEAQRQMRALRSFLLKNLPERCWLLESSRSNRGFHFVFNLDRRVESYVAIRFCQLLFRLTGLPDHTEIYPPNRVVPPKEMGNLVAIPGSMTWWKDTGGSVILDRYSCSPIPHGEWVEELESIVPLRVSLIEELASKNSVDLFKTPAPVNVSASVFGASRVYVGGTANGLVNPTYKPPARFETVGDVIALIHALGSDVSFTNPCSTAGFTIAFNLTIPLCIKKHAHPEDLQGAAILYDEVSKRLGYKCHHHSCSGNIDSATKTTIREALSLVGLSISHDRLDGSGLTFYHGGGISPRLVAALAPPPVASEDDPSLPTVEEVPEQRVFFTAPRYDFTEEEMDWGTAVVFNNERDHARPSSPNQSFEDKRIAHGALFQCTRGRVGESKQGFECTNHHIDPKFFPLSCGNNRLCAIEGRQRALKTANFVLGHPKYAGVWSQDMDQYVGSGIAVVTYDVEPEGEPLDRLRRLRKITVRLNGGRRRQDGIQTGLHVCYPYQLPRLLERLRRDGITPTGVHSYCPQNGRATHEEAPAFLDEQGPERLRHLQAVVQVIYDVASEPSRLVKRALATRDEALLLGVLNAYESGIKSTSGPRFSLPWYSEDVEREENLALREQLGIQPRSAFCEVEVEDEHGKKCKCGKPKVHTVWDGAGGVLARGEVPWQNRSKAFSLLRARCFERLGDVPEDPYVPYRPMRGPAANPPHPSTLRRLTVLT